MVTRFELVAEVAEVDPQVSPVRRVDPVGATSYSVATTIPVLVDTLTSSDTEAGPSSTVGCAAGGSVKVRVSARVSRSPSSAGSMRG